MVVLLGGVPPVAMVSGPPGGVGDGVAVLTGVGGGNNRVTLGNGTSVGVSVGVGVTVGVEVRMGPVGVGRVGVGGLGVVVLVAVPALVAVGVPVVSGIKTEVGEEYSEKPVLLTASMR